jgi:hypothetical protein
MASENFGYRSVRLCRFATMAGFGKFPDSRQILDNRPRNILFLTYQFELFVPSAELTGFQSTFHTPGENRSCRANIRVAISNSWLCTSEGREFGRSLIQ